MYVITRYTLRVNLVKINSVVRTVGLKASKPVYLCWFVLQCVDFFFLRQQTLLSYHCPFIGLGEL